LTYASYNSGVMPGIVGNVVTWNMPELSLFGRCDFMLVVNTPAGAQIGDQFAVTLALTSAGLEANPAEIPTI
jgi:hypothetical protein